MFAVRSLIVFLLAFVALVSALPLPLEPYTGQQRRAVSDVRKKCPRTPAASSAEPEAPASSSSVADPAPPPPKATPQAATSKPASVSALFPKGTGKKAWSTSPNFKSPLALSDNTLRPSGGKSGLSHPYVTAPDGKKSMKVSFPKGAYAYEGPLGGIGFNAPGPKSVDLTTAKEATFGYSILFDKGFKFNKGGKLPGLYGGDSAEDKSCSGGNKSPACWSTRLMWRRGGDGEVYAYLPPGKAGNKKVCKVKPFSECNDEFGASIGRGAFKFAGGKRTTVTQRIRLNDAGKANGEIELFANGKSVIKATGLTLRRNGQGRIRGMFFSSFFGGHDPSWASPRSQNFYISDISVAITETL